MIPTKTYDAAITSGTADTAQAQIAMTPEMYELLSAGIYEDRPLAIVRELACNARDAQKEAGNGHRMIQIHLPNSFEPFFSVRDFGTGLTHQQVFDIYLTYGASTKRGSNEFVGMFGIGSKSPLAYTDSFLVTTYQDGVEIQYNIYKDNGIPKIAKLVELPTTEENGLKVTVAIRSQDFGTFRDKVENFFKLFDQEVEIEGAYVNTEVTYSEQNDLYHLTNDYHTGAYALMGGVPYRLSNDIRDDLKKDLKVDTIILPFDLGALNIASSRENLSFNEGDATDTAIKDRVKEIKLVFQQNLENALKGSTTIREAVEMLFDNYGMTQSNYWSSTTNMDHVEWGGKSIKEWRIMMKEKIAFKLRRFSGHNEDGALREIDFGLFQGRKLQIVFFEGDRKTGNIKAIKQWSGQNYKTALLDVPQEVKDLITEYHGEVETVKCSEVWDDLFPETEKEKRKVVKVSGVFNRNRAKKGRYGNSTEEIKEIDGTETGYYVDMVRDVVTINGNNINRMNLHWLVDEGIVESLWFIRGTAAKKNRPAGLIKLDDVVESLLTAKVNQKAIQDHTASSAWYSMENVRISNDYSALVEAGILDNYPTIAFFNDADKRRKVERKSETLSVILDKAEYVCKSGSAFSVSDRVRKVEKRILARYEAEHKAFEAKYPLLLCAMESSWRFTDEAKKQVNDLLKTLI